MKIRKTFTFLAIVLFVANNAFGQEKLIHKEVFPSGLSFEFGTSSYSVKDEFFSKQKYSGTMPYANISWVKAHNKYIYQLSTEFQASEEIKNHNVKAEVVQFSINQSFLYPLNGKNSASKSFYAYLGPYSDVFVFVNQPIIAMEGLGIDESLLILASLGIKSALIVPIRHNLRAEGSLAFSLLSAGIRTVEDEVSDESSGDILDPFSGTNAAAKLGLRYYLNQRISFNLASNLRFIRITKWDPLTSAGNSITLGLTYKF